MQTIGQQLIIAAIPILPALVFFVLAISGRLLRDNAQYVAILGVTVSLVFSVFALLFVAGIIPGGGQPIEFSVNWIDLGGGGSFPVGVYIDGLAAVMLVVVCFVSLMIQLYSGGFMEGDRRFAWYYAVLNLFTASMLGLVLAPNFIELYICWELVGLCSYLLIGHWYEKPSARDASLKAFIVTASGMRPSLSRSSSSGGRRGRPPSMVSPKPPRPGSSAGRSLRRRWCWSSSGPWARAPSSRCTCGCQTRWRALRRSRP